MRLARALTLLALLLLAGCQAVAAPVSPLAAPAARGLSAPLSPLYLPVVGAP